MVKYLLTLYPLKIGALTQIFLHFTTEPGEKLMEIFSTLRRIYVYKEEKGVNDYTNLEGAVKVKNAR